jgi:hypothetical protein
MRLAFDVKTASITLKPPSRRSSKTFGTSTRPWRLSKSAPATSCAHPVRLGRLKFRLLTSAAHIAQIHLLEAKTLTAKDRNGFFSDPHSRFCVGTPQKRSSIEFKPLNPTYDEDLTACCFDLADVVVNCFDDDQLTIRDDVIGAATVASLSATLRHRVFWCWV